MVTNLQMREDVEALARAYKGKDGNPLYSAVMDLIVRANWKIYEEGETVCDALNELFADKLEAKRAEGERKGWIEGKNEDGKSTLSIESLYRKETDNGWTILGLTKGVQKTKEGDIKSRYSRLGLYSCPESSISTSPVSKPWNVAWRLKDKRISFPAS